MEKINDTYIRQLPKLDLHCHLDGSLSPDFVSSVLPEYTDSNELLSAMQAPADCSSLTEYLRCFDIPIRALQNATSLTNAVVDVIRQAYEENVRYIELRFAPSFSVNDNFSYNDVCEAAIKGSQIGYARYEVHSSIILCAMRHLDVTTNLKVLKAAREYLGYGICALDLAGDESMFPNEMFVDLFKEANRLEVPYTIHSGECGSTENVRMALSLGAKRVGHGIALIKEPSLIKECMDVRMGLELCPTSNFQTKASDSYANYPLKKYLELGLPATVNTDNRTVSNTNMTDEIKLITSKLGIDKADLKMLYTNAVEISFADDNIKHQLLKMSSAY